MGTVCVTGSAGGLGRAICSLLDARGDTTIGVDLHGADVEADLASVGSRADALDAVRARADALDGLVVAAGLGPQTADLAALCSVNYFAAVAFVDGLADCLGAAPAPAAVAVSSNSATIDPTADAALVDACLDGDEERARTLSAGLPGHVVYCSTKRALAIAVRRRAAELGGRGIRLNAVAPGAFDSPLLQGGLDDPELRPLIEALPIPVGRRGTPADVAPLIVFLLSPEARYLHGSVLFVDGGTDALFFPDRVP
jgi:NAD(P)-dependent dehydrogenase (short-subunit alcohol dehydrogenase family)